MNAVETKFYGLYPNELTDIPSYQQIRHERSSHGRGVSIYIRDSIKFRHRSDVPDKGLELICIEIELPKSKSFILLSSYKPSSDLVDVFTRLESAFSYLNRENKELLLLGDTNFDIFNKTVGVITEGNAKHICNSFCSLTQLIEEPRRVKLSSATTVDQIATT